MAIDGGRGGCSERRGCWGIVRGGWGGWGKGGDAGAGVAGAPASSTSTTEERVGPRGSSRAESNLADGHDQDLGGASRWLGVPGVRDRLLQARDRGRQSLASLPDRRRVGSCGAGGAGTAARGQPRGPCDADHRQWDTV